MSRYLTGGQPEPGYHETRYAKSRDVHIAYQVMGNGPPDVVFVPGFVSNVEATWHAPSRARFFDRLASFSRLVLFDKRGTGLSDRSSQVFTLEQRMNDVRAVMDAAGLERAALFGISEGGPMSILFAATYPGRTTALIICGGYAKRAAAPDYTFGWRDEEWAAFFAEITCFGAYPEIGNSSRSKGQRSELRGTRKDRWQTGVGDGKSLCARDSPEPH